MIVINKEKINILKADEGKLLRGKNDNGRTLEDGVYIPPYKTDTVYLSVLIDTLEKAKELYVEEKIEEDSNV